MSGTGNLLLKRKVGNAAVNASGVPVSGALPSCMPAIQLQGLSPVSNSDKTSYLATNFANRMWVGAGAIGAGNSELDDITGNPINGSQFYVLPDASTQSYTRPIWMGAEIRAAEGVAANNGGNPATFAILKAAWDDLTLISGEYYDRNVNATAIYASDYVLVTQKAIYYYIEDRLTRFADVNNLTMGIQSIQFATEADAALLGEKGATKGTQSFMSPILIEQKLTLNAFSVNSVEQPATIHSGSADASIFDLNVETITIGGSATSIDIGNDSTANDTTTTIYGDFVVTGNSYLGVIDGGSF